MLVILLDCILERYPVLRLFFIVVHFVIKLNTNILYTLLLLNLS